LHWLARLFRHHSRARSRCAVTGINLSPPRREIRTNQKRDASGVAGYRPMFWTMREGCGRLVRPRHDPPRFVGSTPRRFERPMPLVETCSRYALSTLLNVSLRPGSTDCPLSCSQHRAPRPPLRHGWRRFLRVAPCPNRRTCARQRSPRFTSVTTWCIPWCRLGAGDFDCRRIRTVSRLHRNCTIEPSTQQLSEHPRTEIQVAQGIDRGFSMAPMLRGKHPKV